MPDNYSPNPSGTVSSQSYGNLGNLRGSGDPNGVVYGRSGWSFYDLDSDTLYFNTGTGRNATWTEFAGGGGGGGIGATYSGSGTPEGVQSGDPGNLYWDATNNVLYVKDTGAGNTGWREIVA